MSSIDNLIAEIIGCPKNKIGYYLEQPWIKTKLVKHFEDAKLVTLYNNRWGKHQEFKFNGFSFGSARKQYAYRKFMGTTVYQHFYARHNILLEFPDNPCLKHFRNDNHIDYYPLELIGLSGITNKPFSDGKNLYESLEKFRSTKLSEGFTIVENKTHIMLKRFVPGIIIDKTLKKTLLSIQEDEIAKFIRKGEEEFNAIPTPTSSAMGGGEDISLGSTSETSSW